MDETSEYRSTPCPGCGRFMVRFGHGQYCSRCASRLKRGHGLESLRIPNLESYSPIKDKMREMKPISTPALTYEDRWKQFCEFVGITKKREAEVPAPIKGDRIIYGVISDLHIPFEDKKAIALSVEWLKNQGASVLYVGGDILDLYSLSRFNQYKSVPVQEEFQAARETLDYFSRSFSSVRLIEGNHEVRERSYLSKRIDVNMLNFILQKSMLQRCSEDMPNVIVESTTIHGTRMGWLTQVGDAVIGHPERQSKLNLRPVEWFNDWLRNWGDTIGFNNRPKLVVAGHTHSCGLTFIGNTMVIESGCCCLVQGYALEPRLYNKPQVLAAVCFSQDLGVTNHNSVKLYFPQV